MQVQKAQSTSFTGIIRSIKVFKTDGSARLLTKTEKKAIYPLKHALKHNYGGEHIITINYAPNTPLLNLSSTYSSKNAKKFTPERFDRVVRPALEKSRNALVKEKSPILSLFFRLLFPFI